MKNAFSPSPSHQCLNSSSTAEKFKFRVSSESLSKFLAVSTYKIKKANWILLTKGWGEYSYSKPERWWIERNKTKSRLKPHRENIKSCRSTCSTQGKLWWAMKHKRLRWPCTLCITSYSSRGFPLRVVWPTACGFTRRTFHVLSFFNFLLCLFTLSYSLTFSYTVLSGAHCRASVACFWNLTLQLLHSSYP